MELTNCMPPGAGGARRSIGWAIRSATISPKIAASIVGTSPRRRLTSTSSVASPSPAVHRAVGATPASPFNAGASHGFRNPGRRRRRPYIAPSHRQVALVRLRGGAVWSCGRGTIAAAEDFDVAVFVEVQGREFPVLLA